MKTIGKWVALPLLVLLAMAFLSSCKEGFFGLAGNRVEKRIDLAFSPGTAKNLTVVSRNGSVEVFPTEGDSIRLVGSVYVRGNVSLSRVAEELDRVDFSAREFADSLEISLSYPEYLEDRPFSSLGASFQLFLPRASFDSLQVKTSNGAIHAKDFEGFMDLKASNGPIQLENCTGVFEVKTSNGGLFLHQLTLQQGSHNFKTSNGIIDADLVPAPSQNGYVLLDTSNNSVRVKLPHDMGGTVEGKTSNGKVSLLGSAGSPVKMEDNAFLLAFSSPGMDFRIDTSNGSIILDQRGK
ncbi:MAG TPA: DUF4097 family beta strand repeat-containing protein [Thermotogota bacterium]|nr:DUF4097 family beta strand repeat-containing protein [Thermotogota bacterium]HRW92012.1 DUF4097 family beta strand repeat-containing protein [Thermotogota bacterium]